MAIVRIGNIWDSFKEYDMVIAPTNGYVGADGRLNMAHGFAKQVLDRFPGVDLILGGWIRYRAQLVNYTYATMGNQRKPYNTWYEGQPKDYAMSRYDVRIKSYNAQAFEYGFIMHPNWREGQKLAILQSSYGYQENARLDLIGRGASSLNNVALKHPKCSFGLPIPGIGTGGLSHHLVIPWLKGILWADNITLWTQERLD